MKPVTLYDIGQKAECSATTVSLALRGHPKISEQTRNKIVKIAAEMGYQRNPLISAHMAYVRTLKTQTITGLCIAFINDRSLKEIDSDSKTQIKRYYYSAKARAQELGYDVSFFNYNEPGMTGRRLSEVLKARGIIGVIFSPFGEGRGQTSIDLQWEAFATAMIDHAILEPALHQVANDEFATIGKLIQRLLDAGFVRIGIALAKHMDEHANHFWLAGFETYNALTEPRHRIPHFIVEDWNKKDFMTWFRKWKPEAIITINDDILKWLDEEGVRVPDDVSCATLYWKEDRAHLSGYYQNHELIASGAVDLVVAQLNRNERGLPASEKSMLVKAVWKNGNTILPRTTSKDASPLLVWKR